MKQDSNSKSQHHLIEKLAKSPSKKNPAAMALGHLGGLKGGKIRAERLSPERRSQIAKLAAEARWKTNG